MPRLHLRRVLAITGAAATAAATLAAAGSAPALAAGTYTYTGQIYNAGAITPAPEGGAADSTGRYIADQGANRIIKVADDGTYTVLNDTYGWGSPRDIDIQGSSLWVIDTLKQKLVELDKATGAVQLEVGSAGQFEAAEGVATDASGVYVSDTYHHRIAKFDTGGHQIWSTTSCNGGLSRVRDVAVGPGGRVYGADTDNNRIVVLDPSSGTCVDSFGTPGTGDGQLKQPRAVSGDGGSGIWVTESGNNRLQHLTSTGGYIAKIGSTGSGAGQFSSPHCVFLDGSYVDVCDTFNYRIERFSVSSSGVPTYHDALLGQPPANGGFAGAESVAYGTDGSIYAVDIGNLRVEKFDRNGSFVWSVGGAGSDPGQFQFVRGVTVAADGTVVVTDSENSRLQLLSPTDGHVLRVVTPTNTKLLRPHYAVMMPDGTFWVTDTYNNRVVHLDSSGNLTSSFTAGGHLSLPQGLAVDSSGNLYVANSGKDTVEEYSPAGSLLKTLATPGRGATQVMSPNGLDLITENGAAHLYIADTGNDRIVVLTSSGGAVATFGNTGTGAALLDTPRGVSVSPVNGQVAVADYAHNRIALFSQSGAPSGHPQPAVADFSGDNRTDVGVWRPATGTWYVRGVGSAQYGTRGDIPVVGDFNGDGRADFAVFRPSNGVWYVRGVGAVQYGTAGDIPVAGDYNGDGHTDIAVWRPSNGTWYVGGVGSLQYGTRGDVPLVGDYNGDGRTDFAVRRTSTGTFYVRGVGSLKYGTHSDQVLVGDFTGDGRTDFAVWRHSTGIWYVSGGGSTQYGTRGDIPVPGDYNGDGRADIAVFRPSNGIWYISGVGSVQYGKAGDVPLPHLIGSP